MTLETVSGTHHKYPLINEPSTGDVFEERPTAINHQRFMICLNTKPKIHTILIIIKFGRIKWN